eukprot:SAG11_NODE_23955_length_380_cov_1.103203_1_plen_111_part_10
MGRSVLSAAHSALAAHHVAATGGVDDAASAPRTKQPTPSLALRASESELAQKNEDGSITAFGVLTPEQRFEFDVRGYFVLRGHYSQAEVAAFNDGIDEVQAIPMTFDNFHD